jgi:hypothetical protein
MGKKHKNKQGLVNHVAKETGVDAKELDRMDVPALEKLDSIIESDDDLLGSDQTSSGGQSDLPESGTTSSDHVGDGSGVDQELETEGEGSSDVQDGVQEVGSDSVGSGSVEPSDLPAGESDISESGTSAGDGGAPQQPVGEVMEEEVQIPPSETPKSPDEVETPQGQGDSTQAVPPRENSGRVVGYHPVTGKKVYLDEQ